MTLPLRCRWTTVFIALAAAMAAAVAHPSDAAAQSVRGWVGSSLRYVQLRPLVSDTFDFADALEQDDGTYRVGGRTVQCEARVLCSALGPGATEHALVATQDLAFTAWGFGVEGLSTTVLLRGRDQFSGEFAWPRSDDRFDAMLAYAELYRPRIRLRLGRQNSTSGLGFASYDGLEVAVSPTPAVRLSGYGGRSLARGLAEPHNEALRGLQDFVPDDQAYLVGGAARLQTHYATSLELRYQREAWADGHFLLSERASADLRTSVLNPARLRASVDYDFAFGDFGKAAVDLELPVGSDWVFELVGRRYVPYFDLSTIWGFFSPVAYKEGQVAVRWSPSPAFSAWVGGGLRSYGETGTTVVRAALESDVTRGRAGLRWQMSDRWSTSASYRVEWGAGAYLNSADGSVSWNTGRFRLSGHGSVFQQIEEFRLGDMLVVGGGMSFLLRLGDRVVFEGGATRYRNHERERSEVDFDWAPSRAWTALRVEIGGDPGVSEARR